MLISYLLPDINTYTNTILFKERNPYDMKVVSTLLFIISRVSILFLF